MRLLVKLVVEDMPGYVCCSHFEKCSSLSLSHRVHKTVLYISVSFAVSYTGLLLLGEGGKIWENGIETCIISCMKRVASPGSMHDTGCLGLVHWDGPEGW